jgi:hypothetical protein
VAESLATQLLHSDQEIDCPNCKYPMWIQYAEIVAQAGVLCPCCRFRIWLRDAEGGMQNLGDIVEREINQVLKGLWR